MHVRRNDRIYYRDTMSGWATPISLGPWDCPRLGPTLATRFREMPHAPALLEYRRLDPRRGARPQTILTTGATSCHAGPLVFLTNDIRLSYGLCNAPIYGPQ